MSSQVSMVDCAVATLVLLATSFIADSAVADSSPLSEQAYPILKKHCARCHSEDLVVPGMDVLDRQSLTDGDYLVPGEPDESAIWQRVGVDRDMPPEGEGSLSEAELSVLKKWIEADAPYPSIGDRPFVSNKQILLAVLDQLRKTEVNNRRFKRFFSFANLNNNWSSVTNEEYLLHQAALSKTANSLSWKPRIVPPRPVDINRTLFVIDLRDYGWDRTDVWQTLLSLYPYGIRFEETADEELNTIARQVRLECGSEVPVLRADWFISNASRPPLYHDIMRLPEHTKQLERMLDVDTEKDYSNDRLDRAGFATSGVSGQNRLVDRHETVYGMYWKSFDFRSSTSRGNIFQFPLGPAFLQNPFPAQTFEHDGGEMIFTLPNRLQGYFLTDGIGKRIDAGPEDVVSDRLKTSGTSAIVNGLSCMACHKHGVIRFEDTVRDGNAVFGQAREKVQSLYPRADRLQARLDQDEKTFLSALQQAIGHLMLPGEEIQTYPEPIGPVARRYSQDLGLEAIAVELGVEDVQQLQQTIQRSSRLRSLGLGPLARGQRVKREMWDSLSGTISTFQLTALELDLGSPHRVFSE